MDPLILTVLRRRYRTTAPPAITTRLVSSRAAAGTNAKEYESTVKPFNASFSPDAPNVSPSPAVVGSLLVAEAESRLARV